jgi:hypothetical protein
MNLCLCQTETARAASAAAYLLQQSCNYNIFTEATVTKGVRQPLASVLSIHARQHACKGVQRILRGQP